MTNNTCPPCQYPSVCSPGRCRMEEDPERFPSRENIEYGEFHWADGWYFKRLDDGSVRIRKPVGAFSDGSHQNLEAIIPATQWASIVCSVSKNGETSERWNRAQDFHGRNELASR